MMIGFIPRIRADESYFALLVAGGSLLMAIAVAWLCVSIRCRKCNALLGWKAVREQDSGAWFIWLFTNEICPVCRDDAGKPK
jgi:hypothetical protein